MRISVIFGTRPEAIKLAPVILALQRTAGIECRVCVTGQHREMLQQILNVFDIRPDQDLQLMKPDQSLGGFTSLAIEATDRYIAANRPDLVLVQGDTTTVFCAALACFYQRVAIGHVEAGLRTWNLDAPWPEEANRVLTSRLANLHFAPTEGACRNLLREGVRPESILVTGNTVIDALLLAIERLNVNCPYIPELPESLQPMIGDDHGPRMVLITGHRRENLGAGFISICEAIAALAFQFPEVHFVYPVHLNPNVQEPVMRILGLARKSVQNIHLIPPQPYLQFVGLLARSHIVLTDSGGVQEEAPSLGKPVLVMRDTTERPEAVEAGTVRLVGADSQRIVSEVSRLLTESRAYDEMSRAHNPYGDGHAADRIVNACVEFGQSKGAAL